MTWRYEQATGRLSRDGIPLTVGYSGFAEGRNNPDMQMVRDVGPIPQGRWQLATIFDSPSHGPRCILLVAEEGTNTWGRSGFLIHGDSIGTPGQASHGCIIVGRHERELVWGTGDRALEVVP